MKKSIKKNHKGITLCEVLVAMTIFSLTALVLATMVSTTTKININNHKMNEQMEEQAPSAELSDTTKSTEKNTDNMVIKRDVGGTSIEIPVVVWNIGSASDIADFKFFTAN